MRRFLTYFLTILTLLIADLSWSQQANETFGQSRVQYKKFKWKYIVTKHFYVYYYNGGNEIAHNVARFAETDINEISSLVGMSVDDDDKIALIVYNSFQDLQQSNINIDQYSLVGGETKLVKRKAEIAFPGTQVGLRKEVKKELTRLLSTIMMYGGNLKDMVQSSYIYTLPDWLIPGIANYAGYGWSEEMDSYVRDFDLSLIKNPSYLTGREAEIIGHSIWNYIDKNYGKSALQNILHITGIVKNVETAISSSLAESYPAFVDQWKLFYSKSGKDTSIISKEALPIKIRKHAQVGAIKISPDRRNLAYTTEEQGRVAVYVYNFKEKKSTKILRSGSLAPAAKVQKGIPYIDWRTPRILGILYYHKGYLKLKSVNISSGDASEIPLSKYEQCNGFSFSDDGKKVALSLIFKGQSDIFQYDFKKNKMAPITTDLWDDLQPDYLPDNETIVFSSNRTHDTLIKLPGSFDQINQDFNLFEVKPEQELAKRISFWKSAETLPMPRGESDLYFIRTLDRKKQIYRQNSTGVIQFSSFPQSVGVFDLTERGDFAAVRFKKKRNRIFYIPKFKFVEGEVLDDSSSALTEDEILPNRFKSIDDLHPDSLTFQSDADRKDRKNPEIEKRKVWMLYPHKYRRQLGIESIIAALRVDQLRGMGINMETGMADVFGNHQIKTGLMIITDLKSSIYFAEYKYLKKRIDYRFRYEKDVIYAANTEAVHRYTSNRIMTGVSYPLNVANRLELTGSYLTTRYTDFDLLNNDTVRGYAQLGVQYVVDKTRTKGMNAIVGTRGKITWDNFSSFNGQELSFGKFKFDIRHYKKLSKNLTLALRGSGGSFLGKSKKNFLLGGVDNWLSFTPTTETGNGNSPLNLQADVNNSDLLFLEYATPMRGYLYNRRFGNNYLLFNGELRIPAFRELGSGPVPSSFFKNLQFNLFYDIGAAWSGASPFSRNNDFNTQIIGSSPFSATVTNYRNPWLVGLGGGFRTIILGYYVKADMAWEVENFSLSTGNISLNPILHISLGYDF